MITTKGRLYQWDTGRLIEVYPVDNYKVDEIHVYNGTTPFALVLKTWVENGRTYAKIPDSLLQSDNNMDIYAIMSDDLGEYTTEHVNVTVLSRARPEDYVYSEEDAKIWSALEKRVKALEESGGKGTVKSVNNIKPDENGNIEVGGKFVVTITPNEEENGYVADKTFEEIKKAYNDGKVVVAIYYGMLEDINAKRMNELQIHNVYNSVISFNAAQVGSNLQISILSNNYVQISKSKYVSKPTVGKVGQFLAVNSVNSSSVEGEPMSFEFVDPPQGFSGSWNDLQDKPFFEEEQPIKEDLFVHRYVGRWETEVDKLSAIVKPNKNYTVSFLGNDYNITTDSESEYVVMVGIVDALLWIGNPTLIETTYDLSNRTENLDLPFVIYWKSDEFNFEGVTPTVVIDSSTSASIGQSLTISRITGMETVYETLDENYIPNNIPKIQTAEVGQTLVVKEVDENGKPTEWECVDASGGAGGASSWNDLKDKPFDSEVKITENVIVEIEHDFSQGNLTVKLPNFHRGDLMYLTINGNEYEGRYNYIGAPVYSGGIDFPADCPLSCGLNGVLSDNTGTLGVTSVKFFTKIIEEIVSPLDSKFLSEDVVVIDGNIPTTTEVKSFIPIINVHDGLKVGSKYTTYEAMVDNYNTTMSIVEFGSDVSSGTSIILDLGYKKCEEGFYIRFKISHTNEQSNFDVKIGSDYVKGTASFKNVFKSSAEYNYIAGKHIHDRVWLLIVHTYNGSEYETHTMLVVDALEQISKFEITNADGLTFDASSIKGWFR